MKYFLGTLAIIAALLVGTHTANAQTAYCGTITSANHSSCCGLQQPENDTQCGTYETQQQAAAAPAGSCTNITGDDLYDQCCSDNNQKFACIQYKKNNAGTTKPVTAQQVGGGTQSTAAVNGTAANSNNISLNSSAATQQALKACTDIKFVTLLDIAIWAKCLIGSIVIPGIFTLAFAAFLWGMFKFIRSSDTKDKQDSKQFIYGGLIGLFVMVSVWGIIKILGTTLGIESTVPTLQTTSLDLKNASKK
jgi:hypothetical protein